MNIDIFPTVLALAGIQLPQDRIIDGKIGREEGEKWSHTVADTIWKGLRVEITKQVS